MTTKPKRFFFIDLLRGWAVIMMVETHVVNTYMDPSLRVNRWFWVVNFINGLIAPSFIFISGFALRIVTDRKWEQYLGWTPVFRKQLLRLSLIFLLAYIMHLPFAMGEGGAITLPQGWGPLFIVDVLHVIVLPLIFLQFLVLLLKKQERIVSAAILLGSLFAFLTPVVWQSDFTESLGLILGNYFNNRQGSLFPVFPWAAFTFFGYATGHFFMKYHKAEREKVYIRRLAIFSVAGIIVAMGLYASPLRIFPEGSFWLTSPSWLFTRVGLVSLLLSLMWYYEKNMARGGFSVVGMFGQRSLLVYCMHLSMIYGTFGLPKLSYGNYNHISFALSIATSLLILVVMFFLTYWWNRPAEERKTAWKYLAIAVLLWGLSALFWERLVDLVEPVTVTASRIVGSVQYLL